MNFIGLNFEVENCYSIALANFSYYVNFALNLESERLQIEK